MQIYMQSKDVQTLIIILSLFPIKVFIKSKLKKKLEGVTLLEEETTI